MLIGTDVCICVVFVWEQTVVPRGNPPARFYLYCLNLYIFIYTQSHLSTCIYRIALYYSMVTILDFHFRVYNPYTLISHSWTTVSYHFCTKNSKKYSLS